MKPAMLGLDIGGTKIAAAIVHADGSLALQQTTATPVEQGAAAILRSSCELALHVLAGASAAGISVAAAGAGSAGLVDRQHGTICYAGATLPGWMGLDLQHQLSQRLGLPVSVDNDVNALALGEACFGAGRAYRDVLYVAVGTGIGGALVLEGRLRRGATWSAGELGHLLVDWDGARLCNCGQPGHLEAYAAGPAMARRYRALAGGDELCDLRLVAERAQAGDTQAQQVLAEGASILGRALGGLLCALDPQALVIGGGVPDSGPHWWTPLSQALRATPLPGPAAIEILPAQLGQRAVLVGAAWLARCEHLPD